MSFAAPVLLVLLLAVPAAAFAYRALDRARARRSAAWAPPALQPNMVERPPSWRRHLPTALLLVGVAILLVGFARPKASFTVSTQEATLVVVLDVSGSMAASDAPPSRLARAKLLADEFVRDLPHGYQMAVVSFSDHSAVVASPTHDLARVRAAIAAARTGPQGTALADAVVRAVKVGQSVKGSPGSSKRPPAVVVLLSDGGQTAGRVTPQQAAQAARRAGIPVATVLVGTPGGVVTQKLQGGYSERIQVPAEPTVLQAISSGSGGRYHSSPAAVDPRQVYRALGSRVGTRRKTVEVTAAAAAGGLAFMLAGALLGGLWFRRVP
ncbi:MAG TPA: VWA domain-containing protein [Gaiellaceae bacterium]|nr:VWA domain-containing protein [Gaiellaceae bacterium]